MRHLKSHNSIIKLSDLIKQSESQKAFTKVGLNINVQMKRKPSKPSIKKPIKLSIETNLQSNRNHESTKKARSPMNQPLPMSTTSANGGSFGFIHSKPNNFMVKRSTKELTVPQEMQFQTQIRAENEKIKMQKIKERTDSVEKFEQQMLDQERYGLTCKNESQKMFCFRQVPKAEGYRQKVYPTVSSQFLTQINQKVHIES